MTDVADFDLQKEPALGRPPAPGPPSRAPWMIGAAVVALAVAGYVFYSRGGDRAPVGPQGATSTEAAVAPPAPLGADVEPIELPPLDASDALVRELVRALSAHPTIAAWLASDGLIRNFTVVVENIAAGRTPARQLRALRPAEPFTVIDVGGTPVLDQRSYRRYNDIAAAVASVDAGGAARLYSTLKPRIEEAYAEIGSGPFDRTLERALVSLLQTPAVDGDVALAPKGALYLFNDARLERLTPAQKQFIRMGPRNVRTIQRTLRDVARALGVPAERLPAR